MYKLLAVPLIFFSCNIFACADKNLLQAIQDSNVETVQDLLKNSSLTAQENVMYLDLAQETITKKRQEIELAGTQKIKNALLALATAAFATYISTEGITQYLQTDEATSRFMRMTTIILNVIWFEIYKFRADALDLQLEKQYQNALKVKILLWQASASIPSISREVNNDIIKESSNL